MNYCLTPEAVILINREHVALTGEPHAVINRDGLLAALGRPLATFDGFEVFPSVAARAGALVDGLAQAHPFQQGNKRTAWDAVTTYLALANMGLDGTPDDDAAQFVIDVVEHRYDAKGAAVWIADRIEFLN
ncbi:type II toxin-antitoxin system death-on-curing family toxin [Cellulomonas hominis]